MMSECNKLAQKRQDKARLDEKGNPLGIEQEIKIWP